MYYTRQLSTYTLTHMMRSCTSSNCSGELIMDDESQDETSVNPLAELEAMKTVHDAVGGLQSDAQARVLQWILSALGLDASVLSNSKGARHMDSRATRHSLDHRTGEQSGHLDAATYSAFADLLGE